MVRTHAHHATIDFKSGLDAGGHVAGGADGVCPGRPGGDAAPNLVLSNYNSVPVGPFGGLEGQAVVARVGDPSAAWFNPAGLAQEAGAQISGSAGVYERTAISPSALPNGGSSLQQLPNLVGFTIKANSRLTLGFAALTTNSWTQELDSS